MNPTKQEKNKALVFEAFDTLFNNVTTHRPSATGPLTTFSTALISQPGRDGLFNLIKSMPPTLKYEPGTIVAEGDFVIVHGRFSGFGTPVNWIAADILRIEDGMLVEHWDVIQDEASRASSKSGLPMLATSLASEHWIGFPSSAVRFFSKMLAYFDVWRPCHAPGGCQQSEVRPVKLAREIPIAQNSRPD